jgi:uncharacterized protein with von Willebrand factor type A (vWA) domain
MAQRFADNIVHFARILRAAGLRVGTDRALCAVAAIETLGVARRDDVHAALSAVMLDAHEQQPVFDAAFDAFWRDPNLLEQLLQQSLPTVRAAPDPDAPAAQPRRVADALAAQRPAAQGVSNDDEPDSEDAADTVMTQSQRERLQSMDFESMSAAEFVLARDLAQRIELPLRPIHSRRRRGAPRGRLDLRSALRGMPRQPDMPKLAFDQRERLRPPLVILIDISGSMERYSRAFLHFAHGLTRRHRGTHTFVFGTRLTDISRCLRHRDPDQALAMAGIAAQDWRGGTRIGHSLADFNRHWARRVLTGNASLLLVTDGLDREDAGELSRAAADLSRWAREVIWLNPLLRFTGFEPRASGVRALIPHVSAMIPVHDLASLADIAHAIERQRTDRSHIRMTQLARQFAPNRQGSTHHESRG